MVRHGETEWSRSHRHTGRTDLPLTRHGEQQATGLAQMLSGLRPALVLCSPRRRAMDTARLAGFDAVVVADDLAEWEYGDYEGLTSAQIRENRRGWTIWTGDPPGGETAREVAARADRLLAQIQTHLLQADVLLFGHGHFSRVLAARWLGQPASAGGMFTLRPAAPCVLGHEYDAPVVLHWNLVDTRESTGRGVR
ncbi:MAG TPA: histidine phosphatase family protein [Mycobacteriales bacterium]